MALSLTSLETNVYDANPHCLAVNASVLAELGTRESVQKQLQKARDAESAASQALALVTDTAYVNTVKSSVGDVMTTASTVPAVVELSPASVVADNALGSAVNAAKSAISSVTDAASSALGTSAVASATSAAQAAVASVGAGGTGSIIPSASDLAAQVAGADTDSIVELAKLGADMYIKQQTCGICDLDDAELVAGILQDGLEGITDDAMSALTTGIVPDTAATAQYGMLAGVTYESEEALMAAQQAAIDTSKSANLALAKEAGASLAEGIMTNLNQGTLSPDVLVENFDANMSALGTAIAGYVGAAVADVPGSNPCASQAVTDYALGCASLMNTINSFANKANGLMSYATMLVDQAEDIYRHGPEILISMAETTVQTAANTAIMALRNAAATNCNVALAMNVVQNTVSTAASTAVAGVAVLNTAKDMQGSIGNMINTCEHTDDIIEKGKWLVNNHPVVRTCSDVLKGNSCDLKSYDKLCTNGIKYARACLGTERQNVLTSITHSKSSRSKTSSCDRKIRKGRDKNLYTTTNKTNKYNLYGLLSYAI